MKADRKESLFVALAVMTALGAAASARAQNSAASPGAGEPQARAEDLLQEVTVTAQFRQERAQDTPIAITAVSAEMLEQRSQTSVSELTNQAPSVTLRQQSAAFGNSMTASIRGVGQYDFNPALEPGVGIYIDDVYYPSLTGANFDLMDLDRVEILRGPQGTLAGKNSIGGAVKLYSKKPSGDDTGYVAASYGSYSRVDVRAGADISIIPDKLFARFSGVSRSRDGYIDRLDYACVNPGSGLPSMREADGCKLGTEGGISYTAGRAALRWIATDAVELNLSADVINDNSEIPATTLLYVNPTAAANPNTRINGVPYDSRFVPTNPYTTYATFFTPAGTYTTPVGTVTKNAFIAPASASYDAWDVSGTMDWTLSDTLSLKVISAYREYETTFGSDSDSSPLPVSLGSNHLTHHSNSQEVRLNGSAFGAAFDYTVGAYYFDQTTVYATRQDLMYVAGVGPAYTFFGDDPVDASTKAGFVHGVYHATDKLNLTAGYRYSDESKDYTFSRLNADGTVHALLGALNGVTGSFSGSRSDYRLNADYKWTENFMTYAQFSTGYKGGGVNPRPFTAAQVLPFGPEKLKAYEIGTKSDLFGRTVRLNTSVFYNDYQDIQLTLSACPTSPCALPSNAGDAEVLGAEFETEIHLTDRLQIDASGSFLNFKYTSVRPNVSGVALGMVAPYTPKRKGSAGIQYEVPLSTAGSVTPRFDISYQDEIYTNAANRAANRIGGYAVMNARFTWRSPDERWSSALEVTNLTDKLYYNSVFDSTLAEGSVTAQVGMPRVWAVTVRRNFN